MAKIRKVQFETENAQTAAAGELRQRFTIINDSLPSLATIGPKETAAFDSIAAAASDLVAASRTPGQPDIAEEARSLETAVAAYRDLLCAVTPATIAGRVIKKYAIHDADVRVAAAEDGAKILADIDRLIGNVRESLMNRAREFDAQLAACGAAMSRPDTRTLIEAAESLHAAADRGEVGSDLAGRAVALVGDTLANLHDRGVTQGGSPELNCFDSEKFFTIVAAWRESSGQERGA